MERLPPAQQRAVALLLAALLVAALGAAVWLPIAYLRGQDATLAADAKRIAEFQARIPGREMLLAQEHELQGTLETERTLLPGSTPAVAAAQLQGDLSGLAAAMGGEITTVQILEPEWRHGDRARLPLRDGDARADADRPAHGSRRERRCRRRIGRKPATGGDVRGLRLCTGCDLALSR
jgi:Type II secretion system (T2SS), protein M subtype b